MGNKGGRRDWRGDGTWGAEDDCAEGGGAAAGRRSGGIGSVHDHWSLYRAFP